MALAHDFPEAGIEEAHFQQLKEELDLHLLRVDPKLRQAFLTPLYGLKKQHPKAGNKIADIRARGAGEKNPKGYTRKLSSLGGTNNARNTNARLICTRVASIYTALNHAHHSLEASRAVYDALKQYPPLRSAINIINSDREKKSIQLLSPEEVLLQEENGKQLLEILDGSGTTR